MIEKPVKISNEVNKKFAVIGKGFIYNSHAQAIAEIGGEIIDVVEESGSPDAWKEMVKKTAADCIVILSPNHLHFEMTKFSAEKNKIVLCEKPLTIKSEQAKILIQYPDIFTVCQLRYHPLVQKITSEAKKNYNHKIEMDISVHRDQSYWKSWKGISDKSGGILFNLGIHYFDLLIYFFGEPEKILTKSLTEKGGSGVIKGKNYICNWRISAEESPDSQRRLFKVNGINYDFSLRENLHHFVYQDLLKREGIKPEETLKSIQLIEKIYENFK